MKQGTDRWSARAFLLFFLVLTILILVIIFSYGTIMHLWSLPETEKVEGTGKPRDEGNITERSREDISKNLIYCMDNETGKMNKLILEIFHPKRRKLYYITIPIRTRYTMTASLYRKLVLINPTIPQVIKLSEFSNYFDKDMLYVNGIRIIQDLLEIKIDYYTAVPQSIYGAVFTTEDKEEVEENANYRTLPKEVFAGTFMETRKTVKSEKERKEYLYKIYPDLKTSLSLEEMLHSLNDYSDISDNNICFELIAGTNQNSAYIINKNQVIQQLDSIIAGN